MTPKRFAVKRSGLAEQVVSHLRTLIREGTYNEGDRLPSEAELCAQFDIGRSTLREAMRVLASQSVVIVRHGDGTYVGSGAMRQSFEERIERARLADLYEARAALEGPLAELAAQRHGERDIASMRACLKRRAQAARAGDVAAYIRADFDFHLAIAKAAKSPALRDIYESFLDVARPALENAIEPEYVRSEKDRLHGELCKAIARGDVRKTREIVRSHLKTSFESIAAAL